MKKTLFIVLFFSLFICYSCSGNKKINNEKSLNERIMGDIKNKDVILFGENEHNQRIYKQTFLNFIKAYIKEAQNDSTLSRKIAIVLENTHSFEGLLNQYFNTDDAHYLIDCPSNYPSNVMLNLKLPDIEFYHDLKLIIDSVAIINRSVKNGFDIKLIFPEEDLPAYMEPNERQEYFEKKRDIYTSNYLINKLDSLRGYKFIGLYGIFHIDKRNDPKTPIPKLARLLTDKGIRLYTVALTSYANNDMQPDKDNENTYKILPNEYYDVLAAFKNDEFKNEMLVMNIPSKNVLQNFIDLTKITAKPLDYKFVVTYWQRLTGELLLGNTDSLGYIIKNINKVDAVNSIKNNIYISTIVNQSKNKKISIQLINKSLSNITGLNLHADNIDVWEKKITENNYNIKVRLLTALIYYGTNDEKKEALKELVTLTHKNYNSENEWYSYYLSLTNK